MPSPIAHGIADYMLFRMFGGAESRHNASSPWRLPPMLVMALILSVLPDIGFIPGLLLGDVDGYHNGFANSLFAGLLAALLLALVARFWQRSRFWFWFFSL